MVNVVATHAGHLWSSWIATAGAIALSLAMLVLVAIVMDRGAPKDRGE